MAPDPLKFMDGPFHLWMALFTFGWPSVRNITGHPPTTCGWPPPNLWVARAELMDGPSGANFYTFDAKKCPISWNIAAFVDGSPLLHWSNIVAFGHDR